MPPVTMATSVYMVKPFSYTTTANMKKTAMQFALPVINHKTLTIINHGYTALTTPVGKKRNHHRTCNGFTGYNGNSIGFNGNCNGPCGSVLVSCCLLFVAS